MKRFLYFIFLVVLCLTIDFDIRPSQHYNYLINFWKVGNFDFSLLDVFFLLFLISSFFMFAPRFLHKDSFQRPLHLGFIWFILLGILLPFLIGIYRVYTEGTQSFSSIFSELRPMVYYLLYFPLYYLIESKDDINNLLKFFLLFIVILSIEELFAIVPYGFSISMAELRRLRYMNYFTIRYELYFLPLGIMGFLLYFINIKSLLGKLFSLLGIFLMLIVAIFTATRALLFFTLFGLLISYLLIRREETFPKSIKYGEPILVMSIVVFFLIILILGKGSFLYSYFKDIAEITSLQDSSLIYRLKESKEIFRKICLSPLFGYGFAKEVYIPMIGFSHSNFHNVYLNIALKAGIIGLGSFLFVLFKTLKLLWNSYSKSLDPFLSQVSAMLFVFLIILSIYGMLVNTFMANKVTFIVVIIFVLSERINFLIKNNKPEYGSINE